MRWKNFLRCLEIKVLGVDDTALGVDLRLDQWRAVDRIGSNFTGGQRGFWFGEILDRIADFTLDQLDFHQQMFVVQISGLLQYRLYNLQRLSIVFLFLALAKNSIGNPKV